MEIEIAVNLSIRIQPVEIHFIVKLWISLLLISIFIRLCNLKQYLDWFISLSLHLTHTIMEFCVQQT